MRYFKGLFNFVLFLMLIPGIVLHSQEKVPLASSPALKNQMEAKALLDELVNKYVIKYDNVLKLLEDIESGELEKKCTEEELDAITELLIYLARQGILPNGSNEELILEQDIQELLNPDNDDLYENLSLDYRKDFVIVPAISNSSMEIVLCKGWLQKKFHKIKRAVKKHKKAILIGTIIVAAVAVVAVVCVAAAASTAGAAAVGGAGAAAASGKSDDKEKDKSKKEESEQPESSSSKESASIPVFSSEQQAPLLKEALKEHVSSFKELVAENEFLNDSASITTRDDSSLKETARDLGAIFAHKALEGISEMAAAVPQLNAEIKEISTKFLSEGILHTDDNFLIAQTESCENMIAVGHEKIDQFFSSDQSSLYTAEAKEAGNNFAIGILPPPGFLSKISGNTNKLAEAGKVIDRAGFTKSGRALMKHSYREGSIFPKPIGNPAQVNEHGQRVLESILNHPEKKIIPGEFQRFGTVVDIYAPGIGGARYTTDGEFIGFLEP